MLLRSKTKNSLLALLLAAAALPPAAAFAAAPEPEELLDWALRNVERPYQGRMMFTQWFGKQVRAEEIQVYHKGDQSRREYFAPDGTLTRVIVSDGDRQEVHLVKKGRVLKGDAVKSYEKLMPPEKEHDLLLRNYRFNASGPETVAGRPCWVLDIEPLVVGKPSQRLCLDEETRVALENKRFTPKRTSAVMIRFTRFEPSKELSEDLFALDAGTAAAPGKGLEPDFMTLEQLNAATGRNARVPEELPAGFRFESADYFSVGKQVVRHARYTDGLSVLSLFLTDKPVKLPRGAPLRRAGLSRASLRLSTAGKVLQWQRGRQHFTLMGDVTRELLQTIAAAVK